MVAKRFLNKILVPIDGSASSVMAEETAALIAKKTGANITILHVMQELRMGLQLPQNVLDDLLGSIEQHAKVTIDGARALFSEEKVSTNVETLSGDPADGILEFSKSDYGLIVMGVHGENEKDANALGSVARKVMMHAKCPTLIVKNFTSLSSLLVCVDSSENSIKALEYAAELAEKMGSKITLFNVQERRLFDSSPKAAEELGQKILSKSLDAIGKRKIRVERKLEFGPPSDRIVDAAEKGNHDLIILGSRGLGTVERFLLGSVTYGVSHKAKCSVLIVPAKK